MNLKERAEEAKPGMMVADADEVLALYGVNEALWAENAELRSTDTYFKLHALNNLAESARSRVVELEAENAELRATLAAEQGKQEGAPSEGWVCSCEYTDEYKTGQHLEWRRDGHRVHKNPWHWTLDEMRFHGTARECMQHADKVDGVK